MTGRALKRLRREELLELMVEQAKENERLQGQMEELKMQLESRDLTIGKAGSIAEASLELNGVFAAAQAAADQYLENIRRMSEEQARMSAVVERESKRKAAMLLAQAKETCSRLGQDTKDDCEGLMALLDRVEETCDRLERDARDDCEDLFALLGRVREACGRIEQDMRQRLAALADRVERQGLQERDR